MTQALLGLPPSLFRSTTASTHAPRPGLSFRTGIARTLTYPGSMENQCIATAADGTVWTLTAGGLCKYDVGRNTLTQVVQAKLHKPHPFGFAAHIAPVHASEVYYLHSRNNQPVISRYIKNETGTDLPNLPEGDMPSAITVASDKTLLALGQSAAWLYQPGTPATWKKLPADSGVKLVHLSAGSSGFVLAIGQKGNIYEMLTLKGERWAGTGLKLPIPFWVGACEDGEHWMTAATIYAGGPLYLFNGDKVLQSFNLTQGATGFTAANARACYFFSLQEGGFSRAAVGVIDQQDKRFPTLSDGEARAYNEISTKLGITASEGVRAQYTNANASFASWATKITTLTRPGNITEADWNAVKNQLADELEYVQSVYLLSSNIKTLNSDIALIQTNTYNQVVQMLGLPNKSVDMPNSPVTMILNLVLDKIEGAVIDKAKEAVGSEAIGVAMACYRYGNDLLAVKYDLPDGSTPLIIACSQLAGVLAEGLVQCEKARGDFIKNILEDWGRLSACGEAIRSGTWFWSPGTIYEKIKDAGVEAQLNFYKTLMPVKFKILLSEGAYLLNPPLWPYMPYVPRYALMYKRKTNSSDAALYWFAACIDVSKPEIHTVGKDDKDVFPNQKLLETIFSLKTTPQEFFAGEGGWNLRRVTVSGYRPPADGIGWSPYENVDRPLP